MTALIHVIDDDESFLRSMERRLRGHGYAVATYSSVAEFLRRPDPEAPGCVLTDLQMPKRDGFVGEVAESPPGGVRDRQGGHPHERPGDAGRGRGLPHEARRDR